MHPLSSNLFFTLSFFFSAISENDINIFYFFSLISRSQDDDFPDDDDSDYTFLIVVKFDRIYTPDSYATSCQFM